MRRLAGFTSIAALITAGLVSPWGAMAAAPNASHHVTGRIPPEDGTYHHAKTRVRHYATQHPAAPQAGAVGTTAGKTLAWQGGTTINGQAAQGVVSSTPKVYLVYWGSQWGTQGTNSAGNITLSGDYDGAAPVAEALFKGLGTGGEKWSGTLTQYCDGSSVTTGATTCPANAPHVGYPTGGALAGIWYDNASAEPVPASGSQIGNEALAAAAHFGNTTAASNRYAQYIILSAPGTNPDSYESGNAGCAWHSDAYSSSMNTEIAFTNQPYNMDTNFCGKNFLTAGSGGTLDGYTMTLGHEYAETVTDQYPASGWVNTQAANGGENGDDCAWSSASAYVTMGTGTFAMQPTWSNDTNECDMSHVIVGGQQTNTVTVTSPGNQTGTVGTAKSLQISATDSAGAALTYAATGLPAGLSINASTGLISGTPTTVATYNVTVSATDSTGASGSTGFTWTISAQAGNTVTVTNPGAQTATVGTAKSVQIHATDSAGAALTYSATGLPAGLSINASTGLISGTPTTAGSATSTVKATDSTGASGSVSFAWTVSPKPTGTCTAKQLFVNPGFESGSTGWSATSWVINTDGYLSRTGLGYAWLDGYNSAMTDTVSQKVTIPAGCKATLSYWAEIFTNQTSSSAIDTLTVTVNGTAVQRLSNVNATGSYVQHTVDLSAYAGQTVTVKWTGVQAGATSTSFIVDDTALNVTAPTAVRTTSTGWLFVS